MIQTLWLLMGLMVGAPLAYFVAVYLLLVLRQRLGLVPLVLLGPVLTFAAFVVYTPFAVVLGRGFAQVVDPDMLRFEHGATVSCLFQAHTFEDRVLKIDRITIRRRASVGNSAVLLYGAEIGVATRMASDSVVMKAERLLPGRSYAGCPTREQSDR